MEHLALSTCLDTGSHVDGLLNPVIDQFRLRDGRTVHVHPRSATLHGGTATRGFIVTRSGRRRDRVIAEACYVATGEPGSAEFRIVVAPEWRRHGLGTLLIEALCRAARREGVKFIGGRVASASLSALEWLERCGFESQPCADDAGWLRVHRSLPARVTSQTAAWAGSQLAAPAGWTRPSRTAGALRSY